MHVDKQVIWNPIGFDLFFDDGPFGVVLLDQFFKVLKANEMFRKMIVFPTNYLVGRELFGLLEGESALKLMSLIKTDKALRSSLYINLIFIKRDQTRLTTDGYIKRYQTESGEYNYCLLVFEQDSAGFQYHKDIRKEICRTIVETQEEERAAIGNALHDSVAQLLYGIRLNLQHFIMESGDRERFVPLKKMLNEAIHQVRNVSMDLFPSILLEFGLSQAIHALANRFSFPGFQVSARVQGNFEGFSSSLQLAIYRIIQELLNNCMKHAMADLVLIRIHEKMKKVEIQVTDNGKGFGRNVRQKINQGTGIRNIRSRIKLYQGYVRIKPHKSNNPGTTVKIYLNIEDT